MHAPFIDGDLSQGNRIDSAWLNDINIAVYQALGAAGVAPTTAANVLDNLGFSAFVQTVIGAATAAALRTLLGSTTTGDALFVTASAAAARTLLGTQTVASAGRNIAGRTNSAAPNSKIDITADELIVKDSTGAAQALASVSVTVDITASGANGLDTGAEASSTWYYGWVIAKADGTTAGLLSASSSAPTMPSGYTYKALVSALYNNVSSNFNAYRQFGRRVFYEARQQTPIFAQTNTTEASASVATNIPPIATEMLFTHVSGATADAGGIGGITPYLRIVSGINYYATSWIIRGQGAGQLVQPPAWMGAIPNVGQNIYYLLDNVNGTGSQTLYVNGFTLPGGGE